MQTVRAIGSVESFTDSIGVNTHVNHLDTAYADINRITRALDYLGVSRIRDSYTEDVNLDAYLTLAARDVRFDFLISATSRHDIAWQLGRIARFEASTDFIEGPNETDFWPISYQGQSGFAATRAFQRDLYAAVRASGPLNADGPMPVIQTSLGKGESYGPLGNLSAAADFSNIHAYFNGWGFRRGIAEQLPERLAEAQIVSPGRPTVATEGGWSTALRDPGGFGVSEDAQALMTMNLLLDLRQAGVQATYLYELLEPHANPSATDLDARFGLFRADGTPKPAATSVRNLIAVLDDPNEDAVFTTGSLTYGLQGLPATARQMLLQQSDGDFVLVLWNEPQIWNPATRQKVGVADQAVTLTLAGPEDVTLYDPFFGDGARARWTDARAVTVGLSDRPLVLEIDVDRPAADLVLARAAAAAANSLTVTLSGDAWQGGPRFLVRVDGVQVAPAQEVSASHAAGRTQDFTFTGNFGAGTHRVEVAFLNDGWGGTPATDRNLYVEGITVDGVRHDGARATMLTGDRTAAFDLPFGATAATAAAAQHRLTVRASEDAWQGDARFALRVDGQQVGEMQTVTASRAAGQGQDFAFALPGALSGTHRVEVAFLNDAWGGTPATDRNLYVEGLTLDGAALANTRASLLSSNAPAAFDVFFA